MRKEILIAIVAGIAVGLVIAFGVFRANSAIKKQVEAPEKQITEESPVSTPEEFKISLVKPQNYDVVTETPTTISGITESGSWVIISGEKEDYIEKLQDGSFDQSVELIAGVNQIYLTAISEKQKKSQEDIKVVFSSEFAKEISTNEEPATDEADVVRNRVREKVESLRQNPKAYIGSVTDKNQDSLQIKNPEGEIQLISVDTQNTSFVKITKKTSNIKFEDIAIGDFIVAMGFVGDGTLSSKRILVTEPPSTLKREIVLGEITNIQKKSFSLMSTEGTNWVIEFPKIWKGPEIKELTNSDKLIAVGEPKDNTLIVRTIAIIEKSASATPSPTP